MHLLTESSHCKVNITKIGDAIRGSLLADRPEQIPLLLKSVTERVIALGGKFYIKNFWDDPKPSSLGYVAVHIKIRMPIPQTNEVRGDDQMGFDNQERKYILMELQLHLREIMDGTPYCAKEIAHQIYKAPQEAKEKISAEIISSSQLVYLTAITRLLTPKEDLEKIDKRLRLFQTMGKTKEKATLFLSTVRLFENVEFDEEWSDSLEVFVPRSREAVFLAWKKKVEEVNKLLKSQSITVDEKDVWEYTSVDQRLWTNTAASVNELYTNANQVASLFRNICEQAEKDNPGSKCNFGPGEAHMIKEELSLLNKIKSDLEEELERFMAQLLIKIGRSLEQITGSDSVFLKNLSALQSLNFSGCSQITDSDLFFLGSLSALQSLGLSECTQITDSGLGHLERLVELQSLDLSRCQITNRSLVRLENLTGLQSLSLAYCRQITVEGLAHLWRLTRLRSLNFFGCDQIKGSDLVCAGLQSLFLCQIPNQALPSLQVSQIVSESPFQMHVSETVEHKEPPDTSLVQMSPPQTYPFPLIPQATNIERFVPNRSLILRILTLRVQAKKVAGAAGIAIVFAKLGFYVRDRRAATRAARGDAAICQAAAVTIHKVFDNPTTAIINYGGNNAAIDTVGAVGGAIHKVIDDAANVIINHGFNNVTIGTVGAVGGAITTGFSSAAAVGGVFATILGGTIIVCGGGFVIGGAVAVTGVATAVGGSAVAVAGAATAAAGSATAVTGAATAAIGVGLKTIAQRFNWRRLSHV